MDNHLCGVLTFVGGVSTYEVDCGGVFGDYIGVHQSDGIVSLCEVVALPPVTGSSFFIINFSIFNLQNVYWSGI